MKYVNEKNIQKYSANSVRNTNDRLENNLLKINGQL